MEIVVRSLRVKLVQATYQNVLHEVSLSIWMSYAKENTVNKLIQAPIKVGFTLRIIENKWEGPIPNFMVDWPLLVREIGYVRRDKHHS